MEDQIARIGANYLDIIQGNIEGMDLPYEKEAFDYIILGDVLEHLYHPEEVLVRLSKYLKKDGRFICSIPNIMHTSVMIPLLKGKFEYAESGILDKTHIRFFTLESIVKMLDCCGLKTEKVSGIYSDIEKMEADQEFLGMLCNLPGVVDKNLFQVYQYIFTAKLK